MTAAFLLPAGEPKEVRLRLLRITMGALLLYIIVACFSLVFQGAKLRGRSMPDADVLLRYLLLTQGGKVWLVREVYAFALGLVTVWLIRKESNVNAMRFLALMSLPLLVSRSFASHAVAVRDGTTLAISVDMLHLLVAALWGGGLMALSWVLYCGTEKMTGVFSRAAEMIRRFSVLALASVSILFATGLYQSWIQVGNLTILFGTDYGRVLFVKLVVFLAMVSMGALNWLSTKPRLLRAQLEKKEDLSLARTALTRIGVESFLALLVFLVTGWLTALPPGVHAWHEKRMTKESATPAANNETHQLRPAEGARVEIVSPKAGQIIAGDKVPLSFRLTKGKRGDQVHAYVDGELMGMFTSKNGTLNGINPGKHVLELRVVADDHETELNATDRVEFTVSEQ